MLFRSYDIAFDLSHESPKYVNYDNMDQPIHTTSTESSQANIDTPTITEDLSQTTSNKTDTNPKEDENDDGDSHHEHNSDEESDNPLVLDELNDHIPSKDTSTLSKSLAEVTKRENTEHIYNTQNKSGVRSR